MQLEEFLDNSARQFPNKTALVCGNDRIAYAQLEREVNRLAHALVSAGIQRGDRVVICLPNSVAAVLAIFAALKAGGIFVVLNSTTKADKLAYLLNDCCAAAMITWAGKMASITGCWAQVPRLHSVFIAGGWDSCFDDLRTAGKQVFSLDAIRCGVYQARPPASKCIDIDLAALIYTSGSTGRPKGVMMTHLNMVSAATSITTYLENTAEDVVINVLPLAFDYGLYQVLMMFQVGGTVVLHDSFAFPHLVLDQMVQEGVTGLPIVPTISAMLLQMDLSKYAFPKLRYITNTAAALPVDHIRKLRALFPHVRIFSMYGLTECKRVSYLPPEQIDIRPASVGRAIPNEEVFIVDEHGNHLGPGLVGELVIRGSNVMRGYWQLPEETDRCLRPGPVPGEKVLYSGDLFRMDEQGYLYFVGRKDDIIKTRGEKVSPREVEDAIYALDGVAEVAVLGVRDSVLGSAIKAVIVARPGAQLTRNDVLRHCASRLEDFMVPKVVEFQTTLPKTESGKISKRALAAAAAQTA